MERKNMHKTLLAALGTLVIGSVIATEARAQFGPDPAELELIKLNDDMYVISNVAVPGDIPRTDRP